MAEKEAQPPGVAGQSSDYFTRLLVLAAGPRACACRGGTVDLHAIPFFKGMLAAFSSHANHMLYPSPRHRHAS